MELTFGIGQIHNNGSKQWQKCNWPKLWNIMSADELEQHDLDYTT
uniref:Uncharacterized protein n=1 Tax=Arundo donax TaxID=35708 RepID=A0A0A8Z1Q1_ARUDO